MAIYCVTQTNKIILKIDKYVKTHIPGSNTKACPVTWGKFNS